MPNTASAWGPLFAAWMVTLVATLGALFIGEVMGQTPCVLCWYQRVFMFPLAIVLGVGVFREDTRVWLYAGPLALVGFLIAAYHSLLYFGFVAEALKPCGKGPSCSDAAMTILGMPIPLLSLASFAVVIVLLALVNKRSAS
jgi:disulfide bond formation protein DsbB